MVMSKAGSEVILKCLMGQGNQIDVNELPWGPEDERVPAGIETVVAASQVPISRGLRVEDVMIKEEDRNGGLTAPSRNARSGEDWGLIEVKEEPDG